VIVTTENQFSDAIKFLSKYDEWVVDCETNGLQALKGNQLCGIGIGVKSEHPNLNTGLYYFPFRHQTPDSNLDASRFTKLMEVMNNCKTIVGYNLKFDLKFLKEKGEEIPAKYHDTMLLTYVLDSSQKNYSLDALCRVVLDEPNEWKSDVNFKKMTPPMIKLFPYTCADVHYTYKLFKTLHGVLKRGAPSLDFVYRLELALSKVLIDMELTGCKLDLTGLHKLASELYEKEIRLEEKIYGGRPFNINSLPQLKERLSAAGEVTTGTLRHTDLQAMKSQLAQDVLQYRKVHKMRATYVEPLANKLDDEGRIHCDYKQHGTATGRISCQNPNLQNVPRGDTTEGVGSVSIRSLFINPYPPETELYIVDYKQIEMRFFAHYAKDERIIKAIKAGEDLHTDTAARISRHDRPATFENELILLDTPEPDFIRRDGAPGAAYRAHLA